MGYVIPSQGTRGPFGELKPLAAALTLGFGLSLAPTTYAATFTVTNTNDSGVGSLRAAIAAANAAAGADTVNFTVTGTITLASQITISDDLTIAGPGPGSLTITPTGTDRVFYITQPDVTISGVTIQRTSGAGPSDGGAIYHYSGTLTIQNSVLTGNRSTNRGGAIWSRGTVTIDNSTLSNNQTFYQGGAIFMYYGEVNIINNSTLSGNQATRLPGSGGGVFLYAGSLTIANSTLSGNRAAGGGGAVYGHGYYSYYGGVAKGRTAQTHQVIAKGSHKKAKAKHVHAEARHAHAQGKHAAAKHAHAKAKMVAQKAAHASHAKAKGKVMAKGPVAAYYVNVSINISNSTFSGNQASTGDPGYDGGALYIRYGDISIQNSTFSGNTTLEDGGAIYHRQGSLDILASTFSGNQASYGSAISRFHYYYYQSTLIANSTFSGNTASTSSGNRGGAVFFYAQQVTLRNSTFSGNTAPTGAGGAVTMLGGILDLTSTILANSTDSTGNRDIFRGGAEAGPAGTINASNNLIVNPGGFINGINIANIIGQNPLLGPLANNGGPTQTHALLPGSPAIDKGSNPAPLLVFDQRGAGFPRTTGVQTDIGAFEVQAGPPPPVPIAKIPTLSQWGTIALSALLGTWAVVTGFGRRRRPNGS